MTCFHEYLEIIHALTADDEQHFSSECLGSNSRSSIQKSIRAVERSDDGVHMEWRCMFIARRLFFPPKLGFRARWHRNLLPRKRAQLPLMKRCTWANEQKPPTPTRIWLGLQQLPSVPIQNTNVAMLGSFGFGAVPRALAQARLGGWFEPFVALSWYTWKTWSVNEDLSANVASCFVMGPSAADGGRDDDQGGAQGKVEISLTVVSPRQLCFLKEVLGTWLSVWLSSLCRALNFLATLPRKTEIVVADGWRSWRQVAHFPVEVAVGLAHVRSEFVSARRLQVHRVHLVESRSDLFAEARGAMLRAQGDLVVSKSKAVFEGPNCGHFAEYTFHTL